MHARVRSAVLVGLLSVGCDPYGRWPAEQTVFPWVYTPLDDLEPHEEVRFETDTWVPLVDAEETALYVLKSIEHRKSAPLEEILHFGRSRPRPLVETDPRLSFVGDLMVMDDPAPSYTLGVHGLLDGDLRLGNLETPVSPNHPTDAASLVAGYGLYAFNAPLSILDDLPLDVIQLNNNHSLDLGDAGFDQTHKSVSGRGYATVGYDSNTVSATVGSLRIGVLSYTWGINGDPDTVHDLAVIPFGHLDEDISLDRMADEITAHRDDGATHVVVMLHWGYEYEYWPDPHFMVLARRMVGLGADVIVGHGPHVAQPSEICAVNQPLTTPGIGQCALRTDDGEQRDAAILYSLGNFGTDLVGIELQVGVVGSVSLDPVRGISGVGWEAIARTVTPDGTTVVPLADLIEVAPEGSTSTPAEPQPYAAEAARLDQLLGTSSKRTR